MSSNINTIMANLYGLGANSSMSNLAIGKSNTADYPLDVLGSINFTGSLLQNGAPFAGSQFTTISGSNIALLGGSNLAIGKSNAAYALDVVGDINCTGNIKVNGTNFVGGGGTNSNVTTVSRNWNFAQYDDYGTGTTWYKKAISTWVSGTTKTTADAPVFTTITTTGADAFVKIEMSIMAEFNIGNTNNQEWDSGFIIARGTTTTNLVPVYVSSTATSKTTSITTANMTGTDDNSQTVYNKFHAINILRDDDTNSTPKKFEATIIDKVSSVGTYYYACYPLASASVTSSVTINGAYTSNSIGYFEKGPSSLYVEEVSSSAGGVSASAGAAIQVWLTSQQSVAANTQIAWDGIKTTTSGFSLNASKYVVVQNAGTYLISSQLLLIEGVYNGYWFIYINGVSTGKFLHATGGDAGAPNGYVTGTHLLTLNANDYVSIAPGTDQGATCYGNGANTWCSMTLTAVASYNTTGLTSMDMAEAIIAGSTTWGNTVSGTWTIPSGVRRLKIQMVGPGGAGFGPTNISPYASGGGGGAGGYLDVILDATVASSLSYTTKTQANGTGSMSITYNGSTFSCTPGYSAISYNGTNVPGEGGAGGIGVLPASGYMHGFVSAGGDGGGGGNVWNGVSSAVGGQGGASFFGSGGKSGYAGTNGVAYGSGGSGAGATGTGGNGAPGVIIISYMNASGVPNTYNTTAPLSMSGTTLSIANATTSAPGVVQVGSGLSVNAGVVSIPSGVWNPTFTYENGGASISSSVIASSYTIMNNVFYGTLSIRINGFSGAGTAYLGFPYALRQNMNLVTGSLIGNWSTSRYSDVIYPITYKDNSSMFIQRTGSINGHMRLDSGADIAVNNVWTFNLQFFV
jgi:hypothetical protein